MARVIDHLNDLAHRISSVKFVK